MDLHYLLPLGQGEVSLKMPTSVVPQTHHHQPSPLEDVVSSRWLGDGDFWRGAFVIISLKEVWEVRLFLRRFVCFSLIIHLRSALSLLRGRLVLLLPTVGGIRD